MVLHRYVLKEHLAPFMFSFAVIMFLLVVDLILQVADLILGKGIAWGVATELFFLNTAWMVALAIPMAVLVGTLMAFGRLSGDNEVVAMRGLGVGMHQVVWPVLVAGAVIGVSLIWFNDRILPEFNHRARVLMSDIQRKRPAVALADRAGAFVEDFENFRILFGDIDSRSSVLRDLLIYKYESGNYPVTITAQEGEVRFEPAQDEVYLVLHDGEIHRVDEANPEIYVRATFEKKVLRLGEAGHRLSRSVSQYRTDREMGVGMMLARVGEYEQAKQALQMETSQRIGDFFRHVLFEDAGRPERSGDRAFQGLAARMAADGALVGHKQRQVDRLWVEVHKKFSIPVACLVFVLVGAPLGVRVRRSSPAVGAGISIGFFLLYWLFLIGGEKLADRGFVPPWIAMWSPNLLVGAAGTWLSARMFSEGRFWAGRRRCAS